eukprot:Ihof_evm1s323 gene=Ihof_evmTU1s323
MLETLACDLLNEYFGSYVENLNKENLSLQVWKGEVQLEGLTLKQTALEELHLPIDVRSGHIEKLTMRIPWRNIKAEPVVVTIKGLYVLANPRVQVQYDPMLEKQRLQATKQQLLAEFESLKKKQLMKDDHTGDNFNATLVGKIINNLQLVIEDVHLRYEDCTSTPEQPLAIGLTLESFTARSTNEYGEIQFVQGESPFSHKELQLKNLALYYHVNAPMMPSESIQRHEFFAFMNTVSGSIAMGKQGVVPYILGPVTMKANVTLNNTNPLDLTLPKHTVTISLPAIPINLQEVQYQSCMQVLEAFSRSRRGERYRKYKQTPESGDLRLQPRQLWRFAINSILADIKERNRRCTWAFLKQRCQDRNAYVDAYVQMKTLAVLPSEVSASLISLEERLAFEDIRYFRCLGDVKLRNEAPLREAAAKKQAELQQASQSTPNQSRWFSGLWGSTSSAELSQPNVQAQDHPVDQVVKALAMTEEQRDELFTAIGYVGEEGESDSLLPPNYVSSRLSFTLQKGTFTLSTLDDQYCNVPLVEVVFSDLVATLSHRAGSNSLLTEMTLGSLCLHDKITKEAPFATIVGPAYDSAAAQSVPCSPLLAATRGRQEKVPSICGVSKSKALFSFVHESKPINSTADVRIWIYSKALMLVYNPMVVKRVVKFFTPPSHLQVAHSIAVAAQKQVQSTSQSVWTAMHSRTMYDVSITIDAPNIVIPERADDPDTSIVVLDLGQFKINSIHMDSPRRNRCKSTTSLASVDEVAAILATRAESREKGHPSTSYTDTSMYDCFILELNDAQLLSSKARSNWRAAMLLKTSGMHVIDKFSMNMSMNKCITKAGLSPALVTATLPNLEVHASDRKIVDVTSCFIGAFSHSSSAPSTESYQSAPYSVLEEDLNTDDDVVFAQLPMDREMQPKAKDPSSILTMLSFEMPHMLITVHRNQGLASTVDSEVILQRGQALIGLEVTGVAIALEQRPYDTKLSFTVASLSVPDLQGLGGREFPYLMTSRDQVNSTFTEAETGDSKEEMIRLVMHKVGTAHPNFVTEYQGFEMGITMSFNTLLLNVVPETITEVMTFIQTLSDMLDRFYDTPPVSVSSPASSIDPTLPRSQIDSALLQIQPDTASMSEAVPVRRPKMRITANIRQVGVVLVQNKRAVLSADLSGLHLGVEITEDCLLLQGNISGVCVMDRTVDGSLYQHILYNYAKEVLSFRVAKSSKSNSTHQVEEMLLYVRTGDLKLFYTERFFQVIYRYMHDFRYAYRLYEVAASAAVGAAADFTKSVGWTKLDLEVESPIIVLPRSPTSTQVLIGHLGRLTVSNSLGKHPVSGEAMDVMTVGLSNMAFYAGQREHVVNRGLSRRSCPYPTSCESGTGRDVPAATASSSDDTSSYLHRPMINNISFDLVIKQLVDSHSMKDLPQRDVSGTVSNIDITLSQKTYQQLMGTISENLMYELPPGPSGHQKDTQSVPGTVTGPSTASRSSLSDITPVMSKGEDDVESLIMTVSFTAPHVRLVLSTEVPDQDIDSPGQPKLQKEEVGLVEKGLCEVVATGFTLLVQRRSNDYIADVSLYGLKITDLLQVRLPPCRVNGKDFAVIATDDPNMEDIGGLPVEAETDRKESLVHIRVSGADRLSPVYEKQKGVGRLVDISCNTLGLFINIDTWVLLIDFFVAQEITNQASPSPMVSANQPLTPVDPLDTQPIMDAETWNVRVCTLIMTLNQGRKQLARFDICQVACSAYMGGIHDNGLRIDGKLGWLRVLDLTKDGQLYSTAFVTTGAEMLSFSYTQLGNAVPVKEQLRDLDHPAKVGDSLLQLDIGAAYVVYCRRFIDQLFQYLYQFQHVQGLVSYLHTGREQQADLRFYYIIHLHNPAIVVPSSSKSVHALIGYLGNIQMTNEYVDMAQTASSELALRPSPQTPLWVDRLLVEMTRMTLWAAHLDPKMCHGHMSIFNDVAGQATRIEPRMEDINEGWEDLWVLRVARILPEGGCKLTVDRRLALSGTLEALRAPLYKVKCQVADAHVHLTDLSHAIIRGLLEAGNLSEFPTADDPVQLPPPFIPDMVDQWALQDGGLGKEESLLFELVLHNMTLQISEYGYEKNSDPCLIGPKTKPVPLASFRLAESTVTYVSTMSGQTTTDFLCARLKATDLRSDVRHSVHSNILVDTMESYLSQGDDVELISLEVEPSLRVTYIVYPTGETSLTAFLNKSRLIWLWDFFLELQTFLLSPFDIFSATMQHDRLVLHRGPLSPSSTPSAATGRTPATTSTEAMGISPSLTVGNKFTISVYLRKPELVFIYDLSSASSCSVAVQCDCEFKIVMEPSASHGLIHRYLNVNNLFCYSYWIGQKDTMVSLLDRCKFELQWSEKLVWENGETGEGGPTKVPVVETDVQLEFGDAPIRLRLSPQEIDLLQRIIDIYLVPLLDPQDGQGTKPELSENAAASMDMTEKMLYLNAQGYEKAWCRTALDRTNDDLDSAALWLSYSYKGDSPPPTDSDTSSFGLIGEVPAMLSQSFSTYENGKGFVSPSMELLPLTMEPVDGPQRSEEPKVQVTYRELFTLCTKNSVTIQLYMAKNSLVIPLIEFTNEQTLLDIRNWSTVGTLLYQATVRLDFYDSHIARWEPFVERFNVEVKTYVDSKDKTPVLSMRNMGSDQTPVTVTVSSHMLAAIDMAYQSLSTLDSDYWSMPRDRVDYKPYVLENKTGVPLQFWPVVPEGEPYVRMNVETGSSLQFGTNFSVECLGAGVRSQQETQTTIKIKLQGYQPLKHLEVWPSLGSRTGCYGLVTMAEDGTNQEYILVRLMIRNNRKVIEVCSMVQMVNHLPVTVSLSMQDARNEVWSEPVEVGPGAVYPLPMYYIRSNMKVKPMVPGTEYNYCKSLYKYAATIMFLQCLSQDMNRQRDYNMILHREIKKQEVTQFVSYQLHPPLRLENLCPCDMLIALDSEVLQVKSGEIKEAIAVDLQCSVVAQISLLEQPYKASLPFCLHQPGPTVQEGIKTTIEFSEMNRNTMGKTGRTLILNITHHQPVAQGPRTITIWAPYWIINRSGLPLSFRQHWQSEMSCIVPSANSTPFMWSFKNDCGLDRGSLDDVDYVCIQSEDTDWSFPFRIDLVGQSRTIDLKVRARRGLSFSSSKGYEIAGKTSRGLGRFDRVKVTVLLPGIMLINKYALPILYRQVQSNAPHEPASVIRPGQRLPFHWPDSRYPKQLQIQVRHEGVVYESRPFAVDAENGTNFSIKLRGPSGKEISYIPVVVRPVKACYVVILGQPVGRLPTTYVIKNLSSHRITLCQEGVSALTETLGAHMQVPYGWDSLTTPSQKLKISFPGIPDAAGPYYYELNTLRNYSPINYQCYFYIQTPQGLVLEPYQAKDGSYLLVLQARRTIVSDKQLWYQDRQTVRHKATGLMLVIPQGRIDDCAPLGLGQGQGNQADSWVLRPSNQVVSAMAWDMAWEVDKHTRVLRLMPLNPGLETQKFTFKRAVPGTGHISVKVLANGPTRVLQFSDCEPRVRSGTAADLTGSNTPLYSPDTVEYVAQKVKVALSSGLCISLIDNQPVEIANIGLRAMEFVYTETNLHRSVQLRLASIQVDNQLFSEPRKIRPGILSVVMAPLPEAQKGRVRNILANKSNSSQLSLEVNHDMDLENPYFDLYLKISKESTQDVFIVREFNVAMQDFNVFLEEEFAYRVLSLFTVLLAQQDDETALEPDPLQEIEKQFESLSYTRLYIEHLEIQPVDFYISIIPSLEFPPALMELRRKQPLPLVNINYLRLRLSKAQLYHAFDNPRAIFHCIHRQYKQQLLSQWYKGLAQGVSVAARAVASTIATWSLDDEYQKERVRRKEEARTDSPRAQLASGFKGMLEGMASGLTGMVEMPLQGAMNNGVEGMLKGMGKGLVGMVTKPVGGIGDFITDTSSVIHSSASSRPRLEAQVMRLARWIPPERVLAPFDPYTAAGQRLLQCVLVLNNLVAGNPWTLAEEIYQMHVWLNQSLSGGSNCQIEPTTYPARCLIVSTRHIIDVVVTVEGDKRAYRVQTMHKLSSIRSVCASDSTLAIELAIAPMPMERRGSRSPKPMERRYSTMEGRGSRSPQLSTTSYQD